MYITGGIFKPFRIAYSSSNIERRALIHENFEQRALVKAYLYKTLNINSNRLAQKAYRDQAIFSRYCWIFIFYTMGDTILFGHENRP